MKIARNRHLDALCGEYLLGTLRGAARRRFERAVRSEVLVARRLHYWQRVFALRYRKPMEVRPQPETWKRLRRELKLAQYQTPWWRRLGLWQGWAAAATAALVLTLAVQVLRPGGEEPQLAVIAQLAAKDAAPSVTAHRSADGRVLVLTAARAIEAGPQQSYELWLLPAEGGPPISLAVLGKLDDARFSVPQAQVGRIRAGAKLAVSVEPAGGSPTGAPTGPVILVGAVEA
jgi:anti-sigma-K factor RskA